MTLIPSRVSHAFCVRSSLDGRLFLLGLLDRPAATFQVVERSSNEVSPITVTRKYLISRAQMICDSMTRESLVRANPSHSRRSPVATATARTSPLAVRRPHPYRCSSTRYISWQATQ